MPVRSAIVASFLLVAIAGAQQRATAPVEYGSSCSALTGLQLSGATLSYTIRIYPGAFVPPGLAPSLSGRVAPFDTLPVFCRVIVSARLEIWLPIETWNGKLDIVGQGSGGSINYEGMAGAVARGYVTASTADAGAREVHAMTTLAKSVSEVYYGRQPYRSYFTGCGVGGGQGVLAAEQYPDDFDGIAAGAPRFAPVPTAKGSADAASGDVSRFAARGGKLLLYQGDADRDVQPGATRDYYTRATRTLANKDNSVRLRIVDGAGGCGDRRLDTGEMMRALEEWVESRRQGVIR